MRLPLHIAVAPRLRSAVSSLFTLKFADAATENAYREDNFELTVALYRRIVGLGLVLFALSGLLDGVFLGEAKRSAMIVQYGIVVPVSILFIVLSYVDSLRGLIDRFFVGSIGISGLGIIALTIIGYRRGVFLYDNGLFVLIVFVFIHLRLRFIVASLLAWTFFAVYEIAAWNFVPEPPRMIIWNTTLYLVTFILTGMLAGYWFEAYLRTDFLQRRFIDEQTDYMRGLLLDLDYRRHEAEDMSQLDPLTDLFNRRYLTAKYEFESNRRRKDSSALAMIVLDIDHFKRINDRYGHTCGDEILRGLSNVLCEGLRVADVPCRYGGDEFAVMLPKTTHANALDIGQRLREAIAATIFRTASGPLRITVSIGVASLTEDETGGFDELFERADAAMYEAKQAGRNRVQEAPAQPPVNVLKN